MVGFLDEGLLADTAKCKRVYGCYVSVVGFLDEGLLEASRDKLLKSKEFQWLDF
ncbi:TPA: hypothetical protein I8Z94_003061 [Legionella pneumophila]|nr:hypothetical protein [Legionella pneumophila]